MRKLVMNNENRNPIYFLDKNEYKYLVTYMPEKSNYNGILFIMKEPDAGEDAAKRESLKIISEGNKEWFLKRIAGDKEERLTYFKDKGFTNDEIRKAKVDFQYRNRFREMLRFANLDENSLRCSAYANINPLGGGTASSNIYKELISKGKYEVKNRVESIINMINPNTIFVCSDIYQILSDAHNDSNEEKCVPYINARRKYLAFSVNDKTFYEIHHPIFSPRINS